MNKWFVSIQYVLPQQGLSRLVSKVMNCRWKWVKNFLIKWLSERYQINISEAMIPELNQYETFNDFFTRHLKPNARPMGQAMITSPADGVISQVGAIKEGSLLQAKGKWYTVAGLLGSDHYTKNFFQGKFATIYLSPKDYHRVHMPMTGKLLEMTYIPGRLFSVNPATTITIDNLFARNERIVCIFETVQGKMAVVFVGAMLVAGIHTAWAGKVTPSKLLKESRVIYDEEIVIHQGEEIGFFEFGSTVIVLFESTSVEWASTAVRGAIIKVNQALTKNPSNKTPA